MMRLPLSFIPQNSAVPILVWQDCTRIYENYHRWRTPRWPRGDGPAGQGRYQVVLPSIRLRLLAPLRLERRSIRPFLERDDPPRRVLFGRVRSFQCTCRPAIKFYALIGGNPITMRLHRQLWRLDDGLDCRRYGIERVAVMGERV